MARSTEQELDRLYGLPLEEFTAARNKLAAELGHRDKARAEEVRRLPKPTLAVWTINQLARVDKPAVRRLLAAGAALRKAQERALRGAGATPALSKAQTEQREILRDLTSRAQALLTSAGRQATDAMLERISTSFSAAAVDESAWGALKAGRLTAELQPSGFEALAGMHPAQARPASSDSVVDRRRKQREDEERRRELRSRFHDLERVALEAEREAERAETEAAKKRVAAKAARAAADQAEARLDD